MLQAKLSDSATPSNLNASYFLTGKDNKVESYLWNAQRESDPKHTRHDRLSLMVKKLDAIKIYEIAESGNTGFKYGIDVRRRVCVTLA